LEYGEYNHWDNVPMTVKDREIIPLAVCYETDSMVWIITANEIIPNEENFQTLKNATGKTKLTMKFKDKKAP
jgi:hypothetical protein